MDIIFDARAAEELINQMEVYCSGIVKETRDLLGIMKDDDGWRDRKKREFQNSVDALAHDLNKALSMESEYMRTFHQRVTELRG